MKFLKVNYPVDQTRGVSRLLNDLWASEFCYDRYGKNELTSPATNVYESEQEVEIKLALPGYEKDQVKLELAADLLVVKGEAEDREKKESRGVRLEFKNGNFEKKFRLSEKLDADKINASFKNGILTITVPKKENAIPQTRDIEIG